MRTLAALLVVLLGTAACEDVTEIVKPPATPPPATPPMGTSPRAYGDPGPPAAFYGPKCEFSHSVGKAQSCVSGIVTPTPAGLHVYLNFCVANGVNLCQGEPDAYVSLVLPLQAWKVGARATEAIGGKAWIKLHDGREHEARAEEGRPVPVTFEIVSATVETGGMAEYALLQMSLPRVGGAGAPVVISARIN